MLYYRCYIIFALSTQLRARTTPSRRTCTVRLSPLPPPPQSLTTHPHTPSSITHTYPSAPTLISHSYPPFTHSYPLLSSSISHSYPPFPSSITH